jgi:protein-disulfide isomerase
LEAAVTVGLDSADFQQCLNDGRYNDIVAANIEAARQAGVTATPTFFVNGRKLEGAYPFSAFKQQIESLLGS